jgi:hypothetical protein
VAGFEPAPQCPARSDDLLGCRSFLLWQVSPPRFIHGRFVRFVAISLRRSRLTAPADLAHRFLCRRRESILKDDFDGMGAATAFRRTAERGVDPAHPRTGYGGCDRRSYLTVAKDVTAADDHGALLAGGSFSVGAMKPTAAASKPSAAPKGKQDIRTVVRNRPNGGRSTSS